MSGSSLCYELDAARYPTLGNEFFTRLRDKYPRAFRRSVHQHDDQQQQHQSTVRSTPSDSVWSLWECNGDNDKAVVKEAGGILVPISDLSADQRLKQNCDCYRTVKQTGVELVQTLRILRSTLLASYSNSAANVPHAVIDIGDCSDAIDKSKVPSSASQNSPVEPIHDLPRDGTETVCWSGGYDLTAGVNDSTAGNIVINAGDDELQIESIETDTGDAARCQSSLAEERVLLVEEGVQQESASSDGVREGCGDALSVEPRWVESQQATTEDTSTTTSQQLISAATQIGFIDDYSSDVQQHESCIADECQSDMLLESCQSFTALQTKPPLVKKGKPHERNVKSSFGGSFGSRSSRTAFNDGVLGSAEPVRRRRLRLPWMKRKQRYKPHEELSHWTSNFDSWVMSASQSSLESDSAGANTPSLWRTHSQTELQNVDSVSVGWTDSDTDVMSDDPMTESFNNYTSILSVHIISHYFIVCLPAFS